MGYPAQEGGDQAHPQKLGRVDQHPQVPDIGFALFQVRIQGVGIIGQRGDGHVLFGQIGVDLIRPGFGQGLGIDVAGAGIAPFRPAAAGPASHLQALQAGFGGKVDHLLQRERLEDRSNQSHFHRIIHPSFRCWCWSTRYAAP